MHMDPQAFALLMARFDTIEEQNKQQLDLIGKHITDDAKVHKVVERHTTYFKLLGFGIPAATSYIATKLGFK
jgi:hypothetical protein